MIGIPEEAFARGFVALRWIGATLMIVAGEGWGGVWQVGKRGVYAIFRIKWRCL